MNAKVHLIVNRILLILNPNICGAGGCVEQEWHGERAITRQRRRASERPRRGC